MTTTITIKPILGTCSSGKPSDVIIKIDVEVDGLPALTGTKNQVSYADDIRIAAIKDAIRLGIERVKLPSGRWLKAEGFLSDEVVKAIEEINTNPSTIRLTSVLDNLTSAKEWIEAAGGSKSFLTVKALLKGK